MQKVVTCDSCQTQVYVDPQSTQAQACPNCDYVLVPHSPDTNPAPALTPPAVDSVPDITVPPMNIGGSPVPQTTSVPNVPSVLNVPSVPNAPSPPTASFAPIQSETPIATATPNTPNVYGSSFDEKAGVKPFAPGYDEMQQYNRQARQRMFVVVSVACVLVVGLIIGAIVLTVNRVKPTASSSSTSPSKDNSKESESTQTKSPTQSNSIPKRNPIQEPKTVEPSQPASSKKAADGGIVFKSEKTNNSNILFQFKDMAWGIQALAYTPDSRWLYTAKYKIRIFDLERGVGIFESESYSSTLGHFTKFLVTNNSQSLIAGTSKGRIVIYQIKNDGLIEESGKLIGHTHAVNAMAISSNDQLLLTGDANKVVRIWDLKTGKQVHSIETFSRPVLDTKISDDQETGWATDGKNILTIDLIDGSVTNDRKLGTSTPSAAAISHDGTFVAVNHTYNIDVHDVKTGDLLLELKDREIQWSLGFTNDDRFLLSGALGKINQWDVGAATKVGEYDFPGNYIKNFAIAPNRRSLVSIPASAGQALTIQRFSTK